MDHFAEVAAAFAHDVTMHGAHYSRRDKEAWLERLGRAYAEDQHDAGIRSGVLA